MKTTTESCSTAEVWKEISVFYWSNLLLDNLFFKEIPGSKFWVGFLSFESNSKLDRVRMEEKNPPLCLVVEVFKKSSIFKITVKFTFFTLAIKLGNRIFIFTLHLFLNTFQS